MGTFELQFLFYGFVVWMLNAPKEYVLMESLAILFAHYRLQQIWPTVGWQLILFAVLPHIQMLK